MNTKRSMQNVWIRRSSRWALWTLVLLLCWSATGATARAQSLDVGQPVAEAEPVIAVPDVEVITMADLADRDLSQMSADWWKETVRQHKRLLNSREEQIRGQTLRNIIFFAQTYPTADFRPTRGRLFRIYRNDRNEDHRIMALAALLVIGDARDLERLREHVADERSERVRRQTLLALADYYTNHPAR